jgi:quercetin 2,3-dioxygenase
MKKLLYKRANETQHWVGDGFPVRSMFSYVDSKDFSPFLLMDYGGPAEFAPSDRVRGVGPHPHRGFETVTIVYSGEVDHRDSTGRGGSIKPGDVQWMTAASGLVHEEMHSPEYSKRGGPFEMIQLWVNLPKKFKMTEPKYQEIKSARIPVVNFPNGAGTLRVIAGEYQKQKGPASTFSPMNMWDIALKKGGSIDLEVIAGHTALIFVVSGTARLGTGEIIKGPEVANLEREGTSFSLSAIEDAKIVFLGGEPINEPVVGYGPFVMNTKAEIQQAFDDFQNGRMGRIERSLADK